MKNREQIYKIACIILMIDMFIKLLINMNMKVGQSINVLGDFFKLFYLKNTGAAFSILEGNTIFLVVITVIIILILDKTIKKEPNLNKISIISLGMIMGGMFGNLIDRILHHGVIDYLSFKFFSYNFPVFNFADIGITVGALLLLISILLDKKKVLK